MWKALSKVSEYFTPQISEQDQFINSCKNVIQIIRSCAVDETSNLKQSLNLIANFLQKELSAIDLGYFDYIAEHSILSKIANSINSDMPSEHIEPVLNFFLLFVNTELNTHLAQISVHDPITTVLSKLESLDHKCPKDTREFSLNVWKACKSNVLLMEMTALHHETKITYPLLDFFINASLTHTEIGLKARDILLFIVSKHEHGPEFPDFYGQYVCKHIYPHFVLILQDITGYVFTLQFNGSLSSLIHWMDQLLMLSSNFPIDSVFTILDNLMTFKKNLAVSFYLSYFTSKEILKYAIEYATHHLDDVMSCLNSESSQDFNSSIALLKTMLHVKEILPYIIPPSSNEPLDILSCLPSSWSSLINVIQNSSIEYVSDAFPRMEVLGAKRSECNGDSNIYNRLLEILRKSQSISIHDILAITRIIAMFASVAPDLINNALVDSLKEALQQYDNIQALTTEINEEVPDTPELRASILVEFVKEIHSIYIATQTLRQSETQS